MSKNPERELELIYAALGNRNDRSLWPTKLSAAAAVQRLVNSRDEAAMVLLSKTEQERDEARADAENSTAMVREYAAELGREQDRCARLERDLALARSESVLAIADKIHEATQALKKRLAELPRKLRR
jgi:hypothetical protein